jgi:hypothetical protein
MADTILCSRRLHAHGDKAVVTKDSDEIENPALPEHRLDASVRGFGHIALLQ